MSADPRQHRVARSAAALLAVALVLGPAAVALGTTPAQAVERARALEKAGRPEDAERYLSDLVDSERKLARAGRVLLELARLSRSAEDVLAWADRAIARTREAELAASAHLLKGDCHFARGHYISAAFEYEKAAAGASGEEAGRAALKRAASLLAGGDVSTALEAYREVAGEGAVPSELTAWAEVGAARALLASGSSAEAAAEFDRLASTHADAGVRVEALVGAAASHEAAGAPAVALRQLRILAAEYPDTFEGILARERVRVLEERPELALTPP